MEQPAIVNEELSHSPLERSSTSNPRAAEFCQKSAMILFGSLWQKEWSDGGYARFRE
jgi:hypothetical protein